MKTRYDELPIELKWREDKRQELKETIADWTTAIVCAVTAITVCVPSVNQMAEKALKMELPTVNSSNNTGAKSQPDKPMVKLSQLTANQRQPIKAFMQVGSERTNARVYFPCVNGQDCTIHPITGVLSAHRGVDITTSYGKIQRAVGVPGAGKVEVTCKSQPGGAGNYASMFQPGTGVETITMHLTTCNFPMNTKTLIDPGMPIGTSGTTGMSTGVHIHLGMLLNGSYTNPELWTGTMLIDGKMPPP